LRVSRLPVVLLALAVSGAACQQALSIDEARKVTATFEHTPLAPSATTEIDAIEIGGLLHGQNVEDPAALQRRLAMIKAKPPNTTDHNELARFFLDRGRTAFYEGFGRQALNDLNRALAEDAAGSKRERFAIIEFLSHAEMDAGSYGRGIEYLKQGAAEVPLDDGRRIHFNARLAQHYADIGDVTAAEAALAIARETERRSIRWTQVVAEYRAGWAASVAEAEGKLAETRGEYQKSETAFRTALSALEGEPSRARSTWPLDVHGRIARVLLRQGRLLEAESEARAGLNGYLRLRGSQIPGPLLGVLAEVLLEQGRYVEAERVQRTRLGRISSVVVVAQARVLLGSILIAQSKWHEALAEFERIARALADDPKTYDTKFAGNVDRAIAFLKVGHAARALAILDLALERSRQTVGDDHRRTAEIHGLRAMTLVELGDRTAAASEFAQAARILLAPSFEAPDDLTVRPLREQRVALVLDAYIRFLADLQANPIPGIGLDATAVGFRVAEIVRGRYVQRALDESAARAVDQVPDLGSIVRDVQDAARRTTALAGALARMLSEPGHRQNAQSIASLRAEIETLRSARVRLTDEIKKRFPAYAELASPAPTTLEHVRVALRSGEALIAIYVAEDRTFVWAVSKGAVRFSSVPLGTAALEETVGTLRASLASGARVLGDIPAFDVDVAHGLYKALLQPVADVWGPAQRLVIVPHGALAQLPFSLLVTRPSVLAPPRAPLFANYRDVPWLVRTHAVTNVPSAGALVTLRRLPEPVAARRPFVGFGDPYFSVAQARQASAELRAHTVAAVAADPSLHVRDLLVSAGERLEALPRLPDTRDEIRSIGAALQADEGDLFLGERANEQVVKTLNLARYRVIAFATHGLVPGDIEGLTQPALALSAPDVAHVGGDGLLTMDEILGLRLDADWVVLSACNTAGGAGRGAEAISGLGRAFFYAGARALLVSSWAVESSSARALTTEVFQGQQRDPTLGRAGALRRAMLSLIDHGGFSDPSGRVVFSYAHPVFWAPFVLVGDGGE
jgi:CHAT domain-containing protein/tetratricopeptide (TPR) repeat protein